MDDVVQSTLIEDFNECLRTFVDDGTNTSHRYFLARRTALEMLRDRGYSVSASEIDATLKEFRSIYGQDPDLKLLNISASLKSDPSVKIVVRFNDAEMLKVSGVRALSNLEDELSGMILIVQNKVTPQARKALDLLPYNVEVFQISDLLVNISKHVFKPKHEVLSDEEKQKLLQQYRIEEWQLPRILKNDAIARYYGLKKGQVVKITYDGETVNLGVTYRCVW